MKLRVLLENIDHGTVKNPSNPDVMRLVYDSRRAQSGSIFFALRGKNYDGNEFIQDAVDRGAVAIVSEDASLVGDAQTVYINVPDVRKAMADSACLFFGHPSRDLQVVGITGTNGKTTIAHMIRNILSDAGFKPGVIGTIEYEIADRIIPAQRTTPESPDIQNLMNQMVSAECRAAVMEVSSHALMQQRVRGVDFDAVVFTNLTHDHLDYHGSMNDYFKAKTLLFPPYEHRKEGLREIVNLDDPWGEKLIGVLRRNGANPITYGTNPNASVCATRLKIASDGSDVRVKSPWGEEELSLRLLGRFNVSNALAAFACCGSLGVDTGAICRSLNDLKSVRGRLEKVQISRPFNVFVDYAHTEDALMNVLATLRELTSGRLLVVFGCGGNRDRKKRALMGAVVERQADYSILTSDNPRSENPEDIIAEIEKGFKSRDNYEVVVDRKSAIRRGLSLAKPGDVVLIAGKGHENYQEMADRTIPFDDKEVVVELVGS